MSETLLPVCFCGGTSAHTDRVNDLPVLACACGAVRQDVRMTLAEYGEWCRSRYFAGVYYHTYEHDRRVAALRADRYQTPAGARLLDIGSGNNAFVDECRSRGVEAWGQDVAAQSEHAHTYVGQLADIHFPTDHFDVVTVHDVLEHMPDPLAALEGIRRVLRPGGTLWLDFPRFHDEAGRHHWKPTEHLWLLDEAALLGLVRRAGFDVAGVEHPIPSKVLLRVRGPAVARPAILTPAGIGDAYWVMVKLPAFLRKHGLGLPDVYVQDSGGPKRTQPFLDTLPFIHAAGYKPLPTRHPIWREAYIQNGRTVYPAEFGCDYFIAYNGVMRHGASLAESDPDLACVWYPPMFVSKEAQSFRQGLEQDGPYVVAYFTDSGMYKHWLQQFGVERIAETLRLLQRRYRIVLIGAPWDAHKTGSKLAATDSAFVDLVGQTSYDQMLGTLMGASGVFGFPAGNTILATVLRVPTVLLWNRYFDRRFWSNACPPDADYHAVDTATATPDALAALFGVRAQERAA